MSYGIELYRAQAAEYELSETIPLDTVLRASLRRLLARPLDQASISLVLLRVPEDPYEGNPTLINLLPEYGFAAVIVREHGRLVYRHPHPLEELIGQSLRERLIESDPSEISWAFCLVGPGVPKRGTSRPAPAVEGAVPITPYTEGEAPAFRIRRIPEPTPPAAGLEDFGVVAADGERAAFVKVLVPRALFDDLTKARSLSADVEEGGFLLGRVYQDRDSDETFLLEVTAALNAEFTGASLLHFTFTGDSFEAVKRTLQTSHPGERLLGWYHTHLFGATQEMGLSSIDLKLHFTTFRLPWQLAGLINLDENGRTLRFYVRKANEMALCPQWVIHERN
jgi:JAB N-terminal domain